MIRTKEKSQFREKLEAKRFVMGKDEFDAYDFL